MSLKIWMRGGILFLFIFSTLIFFMRIFFGLDFTDSFFHLNNALYSDNLHPFFFLSSIVIRGIASLFGEELIIFRITNALFLYLALILPFLFIKRNFSWDDLLLISAGLIILSPLNANILGYDTLSVFMMSLCFSLIYWWGSLRIYKLIILAILLAVSVFMRLPNVILIFVLGAYIWKVENVQKSFILTFLTLGLIILGYKVYGNMIHFKIFLFQNEHHNPIVLLKNYIGDGLQVLGYILLIVGTSWIWLRLKGKRYAKEVMVLILFPTLVLTVSFSPYWIDYTLFLTATGISWCFYRWFIYKEKRNYHILLFFLLLFVLPFGSNTGLLKASLGMVLFPFMYSISSGKSKYWPVLILVLIPIAIMEYLSMTYEDKAVIQLTKEVNMEKLQGVRTSELRNDFISNVDNKVKYFKKEDYDIIFYGDKTHLFKFLYPESVTADTWKFFQPFDELLEIEEKIGERSVLFFIDKYPGAFSLDTHSQLDSVLKNFQFTRHLEQNILYYTFEEPEG